MKLNYMAGTVIELGSVHVDCWIPPFVEHGWSKVWEGCWEGPVLGVQEAKPTRYYKMQHPNDLSMIQAATVDEIYSAHAMEHLSPNNAYTILGEFQRVLKPGGKMHHVTPDFDSMVKLWNDMSNVYNTELGAFDYERYITICNGVLCPWDGVMANYPGHKSLWGVDVAQFLLKRWGFEDTFAKVEGTDLHFGGSTPKGIYNMIRA